MKKIKLTQNKYALVDDDEFEKLSKHKWCFCAGYAVRNKVNSLNKKTTTGMHKEIMKTPKGFDTDHIDGNKLNNQRENLRICTHAENKWNMGKKVNNKSGFKCVYWETDRNKWRVQIGVNHKKISIGRFNDKIKAFEAYEKACLKYHKHFGRTK